RLEPVRLGGLLGKDGLEREYDDSLRGADGVRFVEVSALGRVVRDAGAASTLLPIPGRALSTTIDLDLQRYVAQIFPAGHRGAVLALNPNSGEILALYSAPGYDPNAFVGGVDPEYWRSLNVNPAHPLLDRAIKTFYPPGSTWKLAIATMALRRGIVTLRSHMPIPCRGGLQYGNRFFRCWNATGQGENAQTLVNMVRFYQMLASDGRARPPYLVHPAVGSGATLGLLPEQLAGLRQAMISVVERGTARGAGRFGGSIAIAGKTGTAQNSHGPDHGWFIGFAPADKPEIVVGAIIEFAREGPYVAPLVTRVIGHYLGVDTTAASN